MVIVFDEVNMWNGGNRSFSVKEGGFSEYGREFTGVRSRGRGGIGVSDYFNKFFLKDGRRVSRGHVVND